MRFTFPARSDIESVEPFDVPAESHGAAGPDRQSGSLESDLLLEGAQVAAGGQLDPGTGDQVVADGQVALGRENDIALRMETAAGVFHEQVAVQGTEGQRVQRTEAAGMIDHQAAIRPDAHGPALGVEQLQSRIQLVEPIHIGHVDPAMGKRSHLVHDIHSQVQSGNGGPGAEDRLIGHDAHMPGASTIDDRAAGIQLDLAGRGEVLPEGQQGLGLGEHRLIALLPGHRRVGHSQSIQQAGVEPPGYPTGHHSPVMQPRVHQPDDSGRHVREHVAVSEIVGRGTARSGLDESRRHESSECLGLRQGQTDVSGMTYDIHKYVRNVGSINVP